MQDGKVCNKCSIEKPMNDFRLRGSNYLNICRGCETSVVQQWRKDNPDKYKKSWNRQYAKMKTYRSMVLNHYSNGDPKCECCQERSVEFLAIDHVDGGGTQHRKDERLNCSWKFYRWLILNNYPVGYRVLCHNCNQSFGAYGYCPHQSEDKNV